MSGSRSQKPMITTSVSFCEHRGDAGPYSIHLDKQTWVYYDLENGNVPFLLCNWVSQKSNKVVYPKETRKENRWP